MRGNNETAAGRELETQRNRTNNIAKQIIKNKR